MSPIVAQQRALRDQIEGAGQDEMYYSRTEGMLSMLPTSTVGRQASVDLLELQGTGEERCASTLVELDHVVLVPAPGIRPLRSQVIR